MRKTTSAAAVLLLVATVTSDLSAQLDFWDVGSPGDGDIGSIAVSLGSVRPQSKLPDGASFASGTAFGVSATVWLHRYLGIRTNVSRARTPGQEGDTFSSVAFENPTVWLYNVDLALRYPLGGGALAIVPYVAGGYGGKTYLWSLNRRSAGTRYNTSFGWSAAGGVEIRPVTSSLGIRIEVLNQRSQFTFFEYAGPHPAHEFYREESVVHEGVVPGELDFPTMNDLVLSIGITVNR